MTTALETALNHASKNRERSVSMLQEFVRIPSMTGEEGHAQEYLASILKKAGAEVTTEEPDIDTMFERFPHIAQYPTHWQHDLILPYSELPTIEDLRASGLESVLNYDGRPNVVGLFKGGNSGRSLILNGHADTVTVEPRSEWTQDPFGGHVANGRLYGRGASDMKGGLLAGILAAVYLSESGIDLLGDLIIQSVVNEEHSGNGTLDLVTRGCRADGAIILEPTNNEVAVSHTGGLYWQVTVPGRARSPGARWKNETLDGISAIEKLPAVIEALLALEKRFNAAKSDDPMESGRAAFSLVMGRVSGGHYETVSASAAVLRGGAYFSPAVGDIHEVMAAFSGAIDAANREDDFLRENPARLEFLHHDDATQQSPQIQLAVALRQSLRDREASDRIVPGPFACDARHLVNQGGIPSVIFGPGTIAQAHKPDEYIEVDEYLDCIEHLIAFICSWCNEPGGQDLAQMTSATLKG